MALERKQANKQSPDVVEGPDRHGQLHEVVEQSDVKSGRLSVLVHFFCSLVEGAESVWGRTYARGIQHNKQQRREAR